MTGQAGFDHMTFLLPARVHRNRERFVAALRAELAAIIARLPTQAPGKGRGTVRRASPVRHPREEIDDGHP
jgi:hypothetical protein